MDLLGKAIVFLSIGLVLCDQNHLDLNRFNAQLDGLDAQLDAMSGPKFNGESNFNGGSKFNNFNSFQNAQHAGGNNQIAAVMGQLGPVIESIQKKCDAAGKSSIGQGLEQTLKDAMICLQTKVNPEDLQQQFAAAARTGTIDEIFKKMCTIWPDVHSCFDSIIKETKKCLEKAEQHAVDQTFGIFDDSNNFFCENNQERIKQFIKEGGAQCIQAVSNDITTCSKSVLNNRKPKDANKIAVDYDAEDCNDFRKVRSCIVKEMGRCQSQVPKQIADDYLAIPQTVVCNSATTLSLFSALNILLVLCTYFYTKMF